jgi:subtilisin family serine protease
VAPGVELVIVKICTQQSGFEADAAAGVEAAIDAGADIINYSQGFSPLKKVGPPPWVWPTTPSLIESAFQAPTEKGILCVVAAGNDGPGTGSIGRPGGLASVLTVGAIDGSGKVLENSSRGPYRQLSSLPSGGVRRFDAVADRSVTTTRKPDVAAPGNNVVAPRAKHGACVHYAQLLDATDGASAYMRYSGTSMATAVVSGLAACALQLARDNNVDLGPNPALTLRQLLINSARPLSSHDRDDCGTGLITWPVLQATLADFAGDAGFREIIFNGGLRLM